MNRSTFSCRLTVIGRLAVAAALLPATLLPAIAQAQITIVAPNESVAESSSTQTGTFDIAVDATGNSLPKVGDFTVNLAVSPTPGLTFTAGAETTADPYIFAGVSEGFTAQLFNSNTTIEATDSASTAPTLVSGDGLVAVTYSVAANTSGTFNLTLVTTGLTPTSLDDQNVNPIPFSVQNATLTVVPTTVYWNGGQNSSWNTLSGSSFVTNWSTTSGSFTDSHALPGANTDVNFTTSGGGSNLSTTLASSFSIKGLTFTSSATSPVSINNNTLTIGADGLTVQSGAAAPTINSGVTLGASQSWNVAGTNPLTIGGTLSLAGHTLTKSGTGTVRVNSAPSLTTGSSLAVNAGTVQINNTTAATVGSNVTVSVAAAATLQLAGSASALSQGLNTVNITNNGAIASGGGLVVSGTNQTVGVVSGQASTSNGATVYTGDTTVGTGSPAQLIATQILQNSLIIGAGSTVMIEPSTGSGGNTSSSSEVASSNSSPIRSALESLLVPGEPPGAIGSQDVDSAASTSGSAAAEAFVAESNASDFSGNFTVGIENSAAFLQSANSDSISTSPAIDLAASPTGSALAGSNSVPEPSSLVLLSLALGIAVAFGTRRRTHGSRGYDE